MVTISVRHNGYGYGAYYNHHGQQKAAFAHKRDQFEQKLDRFRKRCKYFGVDTVVIRQPSFFCGLAAEMGDVRAQRLLTQARNFRGPWADWNPWANDAGERWEEIFNKIGGWPKVVETE